MPTMSLIVKERRIWRELVQAHFTTLQIEFMINKLVYLNIYFTTLQIEFMISKLVYLNLSRKKSHDPNFIEEKINQFHTRFYFTPHQLNQSINHYCLESPC